MKSASRMMPDGPSISTVRCFFGSVKAAYVRYAASPFRWWTALSSTPKDELQDVGTTESWMKMENLKIPSAINLAIPKRVLAIFSLLFLAALILTPKIEAQAGAAIGGQWVTPEGTPASNALLYVCPWTASGIPCYPQAPIYADPGLTVPLTQPFSTDQYGNATVYAVSGSYIVQVQVNSVITYSYGYTTGSGNSGGNLIGTLTPGIIPVATAPHALGDSSVDQDLTNGGSVTIGLNNPLYPTTATCDGAECTVTVGNNYAVDQNVLLGDDFSVSCLTDSGEVNVDTASSTQFTFAEDETSCTGVISSTGGTVTNDYEGLIVNSGADRIAEFTANGDAYIHNKTVIAGEAGGDIPIGICLTTDTTSTCIHEPPSVDSELEIDAGTELMLYSDSPADATLNDSEICTMATGCAFPESIQLLAQVTPPTPPINTMQISAPASVTAYGVRVPGTQGAGSLTNDGAGNLSWVPSGGGGTLTDFLLGVWPAWLTPTVTLATTTPTLAVAAATGQTSHEVVGTCGTATSVSLCPLDSADLPTALQNGTTATTQALGDSSTKLETTAGTLARIANAAYTLPTATSSVLGGVKPDGTTLTNIAGAISCTAATTSQIGCSKPDGSTITIAAGVLSASSGYSVPVRQTVSSGPVDTNGLPTLFPSTSASLSLTTQNVTSTAPFVATAAKGFNAAGAVNYVYQSTSNLTWTGLAASTTDYLYVNASTGATGSTTFVPIYQFGGTPSATSGQFTFNISQMTGYLGNGTTAPATPIVFVGEAVAGASTITSTVAYAYNGLYTSAFATVPSGTGTVFSSNSNIGDTNVRATLRLRCTSSENGYTTGDIVSPMIIGGGGYWQTAPVTVQRNSVQSVTGATTAIGGNNKTSGAVASFTPSNWSYSFVVNRSY